MKQITRRRFLQAGAGVGGMLALPCSISSTHAAMEARLRPYVEPLPLPGNGMVIASPSAPNTYSFRQVAIERRLHPDLPPTPLWAYDDGSGLTGQAGSFGMAVVAQTGTPVAMNFTNLLVRTYPEWLPVDTRLTPLGNQVRLMSHLHGGFVAANSDGNPAITPHGFGYGETQTVYYPNQNPQQPATLLWFHDHAFGATRLNVFAGLAAAYILRDASDTGTPDNANGLPAGPYEMPLVIQDRLFREDGKFLYPVSDIEGVTWIGEYFGNVMLVNGKVWPYAEVEPRLYRLRILNGCNSRILNLDLAGAQMWQIGAEGGLFDVPVPMKQLVLAPAERADVLVDFSKFAHARLMLKNHRVNKPVSSPGPGLETVMQFRVGSKSLIIPRQNTIPTTLVGGRRALLPAPAIRRFITLNEIGAEGPNWLLNINGVRFQPNATYEVPKVGTVEDWVYINLTGDTHPMHVHLVMFQVVGRTPFNVEAYQAAYGGPWGVPGGFDPAPFATGPMEAPAPEERGFKDTVKVNPGYFTTIRAKFELPAGVTAPQSYVHHCHIVEHEDNEMMQAFAVFPE